MRCRSNALFPRRQASCNKAGGRREAVTEGVEMKHTGGRATAIFLAALASGALAAAAPEAPFPAVLRLEDAVRLLKERGFDVLVAEAAVASAEGDVSTAGAIANPNVSLTYGRSFTYGHCTDAQGAPASCGLLPDALYGAGLSDQGAVFDAVTGKRGLRLQAARAALVAARSSRDDALRTLTGQVKQAFVQALVAREALKFARDTAATSAQTAALMKTRREAGAVSEADVARTDVASLEAEQAVDTAAQSLRDAQAALAFLLGVRGRVPDFELDAPELLKASPPGALAGATPESLLEQARRRRPDLVAAARRRERAEAALALARRQRFPDVTLSLSYTQQGTTGTAITPPTITGGISVPLPVFYQQQGEIQRAEADLRTQETQEAKAEAQVATDVAAALSAYTAASRLAARMEGGLLDRARRARDLVSIQYQKGAASLLDFLDAQRTYISTNVEYLQDLSLFWNAVFKVEQAVGEEVR
jgi:cobalt-zinc-cadmium efflux system outer membrane protein